MDKDMDRCILNREFHGINKALLQNVAGGGEGEIDGADAGALNPNGARQITGIGVRKVEGSSTSLSVV